MIMDPMYSPSYSNSGVLVGMGKACFIEFPDSDVERYVILKYLHPKTGWSSVVVTPQTIYAEILRIYTILSSQ